MKSAKSIGVRAGNWLSLKQAQTLLNAPDITTTKGLRDRAIIAVLLGCALRRSEVAALTMNHVQQRDGRWCIVDLYGKHGRVRTLRRDPGPPKTPRRLSAATRHILLSYSFIACAARAYGKLGCPVPPGAWGLATRGLPSQPRRN